MLVDSETERTVIPLNHLPGAQGRLEIANSSLSEFAVLGFEYGMSLDSPHRLVLWEAQFGDFWNGAQVIIDTFLTSGEAKWLRQSGLVLLLPHGYDGAGPEHSSCRIERFLQLSDSKWEVADASVPENPNLYLVHPTTPAQYFHVLRRQLALPFRKPLVVVGPKVLLRHPAATSTLADMGPGTAFQSVLTEPAATAPPAPGVRYVAFVSGKLYYELAKERDARGRSDVVFVRLEEVSPFPAARIQAVLAMYPNAECR
jgi:probable 2-oxoglutarate dehydrogenase E1 component DHKTD1